MQANVLLLYFGHAVGVNTLLFAVTLLAIRSQKSTKLGIPKALGLFLLTCAITGFLYFLANDISPGVIDGSELTPAGLVVEFLMPLCVDAIVLWFLWQPFSLDRLDG